MSDLASSALEARPAEHSLLIAADGGHTTMAAPTDASRPARGLPGNDVLFLVSLAFVFFALIVTIAVIRH